MLLVCNKCWPKDEDIWDKDGPDGWKNIIVIGKWYPGYSYNSRTDESLGKDVNDYIRKHEHLEDPESNEYPVRIAYECWLWV